VCKFVDVIYLSYRVELHVVEFEVVLHVLPTEARSTRLAIWLSINDDARSLTVCKGEGEGLIRGAGHRESTATRIAQLQ